MSLDAPAPLRLEAHLSVASGRGDEFEAMLTAARAAAGAGFEGAVDRSGSARLTLEAADLSALVKTMERVGPYLEALEGLAQLHSISASAGVPPGLRGRLSTLAPVRDLDPMA